MLSEPELEILRVSDLHVDSHVQRTLNDAWASKLAEKWDPHKIGVFKVSRRESGLLAVLDGQHRRSAMLKLDKGGEEVFALVYKGLTVVEEAQIFLRDNVDNVKPNSIDIFRLQVAAEEPTAVEINQVLRDHGLHVSQALDAHGIAAVGALRWVHERGGTVLVDLVLTLIENTWGGGVRSAREANILKGLAYLYMATKGQKLDLEALAHKLGSSTNPSQLLGRARTFKDASGNALYKEVANVALSTYNKGRHHRVTIT